MGYDRAAQDFRWVRLKTQLIRSVTRNPVKGKEKKQRKKRKGKKTRRMKEEKEEGGHQDCLIWQNKRENKAKRAGRRLIARVDAVPSHLNPKITIF